MIISAISNATLNGSVLLIADKYLISFIYSIPNL